jgi:nucleoside-diphosphate-sugar epimerase
MRVFVTGATGYVGAAVVRELVDAGHQVVGLARSDTAAVSLLAAGAEAHRGGLDDPRSLREAAAASDGVIHVAFGAVRRDGNLGTDTDYTAAVQTERRAIVALGEALGGSGRPFVVTSGTAGLAPGRLATEEDVLDPGPATATRAPLEGLALSFAAHGVRVSVVRLAPSVHGDGDRGFVPALIGVARAKGLSAYVGDGSHRWSAVHRLDAARLYRLALETAPAGARLHAVGDEGVPVREIAAAIGRGLDLPVAAVSREEAAGHFGWFAPFVALDNPASSTLTQKEFDWQPVRPGLITGLDTGRYFEERPDSI